MTTLAQRMVEVGETFGQHKGTEEERRWKATLATVVRERLMLRRDISQYNTIELGDVLQKMPELYVFETDIVTTIDELVRTKAIASDILPETAAMPCETVWMEWPSLTSDGSACRIGFLLSSNMARFGDKIVAIFCGSVDNVAKVFGVMSFPCLPMTGGHQFSVHWWMDRHIETASPELVRDIGAYAWDVFKCLFAIMTPRVCDVRDVERSEKLQRRRAKSGKLPLLEFKKVYMRVGIGAPQYRRSGSSPVGESEEGRHHRLHHVVNHFRVYRKDRETPKVSLVPGHWRGNAELGIVLKERHVKK